MMKTKSLAVSLALVAGLAVAGAAQAEGKIYVGAKLAIADADIGGFDNAYTAGVYGGYNLFGKDSHFAADLAGGTLAVEGEIMMTASKGDAPAGKWDINSFAAYGVYRFPLGEKFYLKGKLGVVRYDIDSNTLDPIARAATGIETKLAGGIGGGMKIGPGRLEADITTYSSEVLTYGVGFHMSF
jgi:hypothetical protein